MLTDDERQAIEAAIGHARTREGAALDALRIVQQRRRWVSDETLCAVAEALDLTPAEVDHLATFFSLVFRRPVGRHVILLCDSVSCYIMGHDPLRRHLIARLGIDFGDTTADDRFTLLPVACLGCCDHAPAMMIDRELHLDLTPEAIDPILARYP